MGTGQSHSEDGQPDDEESEYHGHQVHSTQSTDKEYRTQSTECTEQSTGYAE